MLPAARVGDSVEHDNATDTKFQPIIMGAVAVLVIASGGTAGAVLAWVGYASSGGAILDALMAPSGEKIKTGAKTVFTNLKAAALAHEKCKVQHGEVITGAEHVFVEEGNASRFRDRTSCTGFISEGSKAPNQVLIGGKPAKGSRPDLYTAFLAIDMSLSGVSLARSLLTLAKKGFSLGGLAGAAPDVYGVGGTALELGTDRTALQTGKDILDRFTD